MNDFKGKKQRMRHAVFLVYGLKPYRCSLTGDTGFFKGSKKAIGRKEL